MPAYISDGNGPILSRTHHVIDFDPAKFGLPTDKHISLDESCILHARADPTNASFDDTSSSTASSSHSDLTDNTGSVPTCGHRTRTRQTSMSSVSNGKPVQPGLASDQKLLSNGIAISNGQKALPVRPRAASTVSSQQWDEVPREQKEEFQPEPIRSPPPIPFSADHSHDRNSIPSGSIPHQDLNSISPSTTSAPQRPSSHTPPTSVITPASPTSPSSAPPASLDVARHQISDSGHRYSPHQNPSSSSPALATSHPHGSSHLRQRHTLEVPRKQLRGSRDGNDAAFASGRFSPTAAAGPSSSGTRRASLSLARRTTRSIQSDLPRDEVAPDEDAMRWAEAYRQKRASKKRRREEEDDDRVLVGTKVDEHHVNWVTAYNMLTGIRVSVSRTNAKLDRELTDADFETKQKSTFDVAGNELVPSAKYDFKFKDYAPWVFRRLRALFRLDPADYLMSLTGKYILSELGSPGKSGSFFYFSRDYKYIIKTIHHSEHKFLRKILKDYYRHVIENPNTLLSQFYGLHRVKMPYGKKIHFVVMNNLFPPHRDIHQTFDLKGSTAGRDYNESELAANPRATLKDLNWMRRKRHLELGIEKKRLFLGQLQQDVALLKRLEIMDYSLLIGIHDLQRGNEENLRDRTLRVFNPGRGERDSEEPDISVLLRTPSKLENAKKARELREMLRQERPVPMDQAHNPLPNELGEGDNRPCFLFNQDDGGFRATHEDNTPSEEVYYLGVIDCLTHFGMIKKIESFWKGLVKDRSTISALPPDQYGDRFYQFVEGITMSAEEAQRRELAEAEAQKQAATEDSSAEVTERHGICPWKSHSRPKTPIPPMPTYAPPPPPPPAELPPNAQPTSEKVPAESPQSETESVTAEKHPDGPMPLTEKGEAVQPSGHGQSLAVVDEAVEALSADVRRRLESGSQSPMSAKDVTGPRPATPPKRIPRRNAEGPPTPPKYLKPESADSGYGGLNGTMSDSRESSPKLGRKISRESLNKDLPPIPHAKEAVGLSV